MHKKTLVLSFLDILFRFFFFFLRFLSQTKQKNGECHPTSSKANTPTKVCVMKAPLLYKEKTQTAKETARFLSSDLLEETSWVGY